jgi:hypothetical protein
MHESMSQASLLICTFVANSGVGHVWLLSQDYMPTGMLTSPGRNVAFDIAKGACARLSGPRLPIIYAMMHGKLRPLSYLELTSSNS